LQGGVEDDSEGATDEQSVKKKKIKLNHQVKQYFSVDICYPVYCVLCTFY
jgi:hypothetical protein